jgi:pimeloyl-ACP methyl ester carboxylesterase
MTEGVRPADPTVLVIGGFLSSPPVYGPFHDRLLARGARHVEVAQIWTPDWILSIRRGGGAIATRAARALLRAVDRAEGVPLLVIGHSTGGVAARILTATEPYEGRRFAGARRVGALVSLGSPHINAMESDPTRWKGSGSATFANAHVPGAFWAPRVGYVSVASRWMVGYEEGVEQDAGQRTARRFYEQVLPPPHPPAMEGDGAIPVDAALLPGARHLVLDGVAHAPGARHRWYGSDDVIDSWWPTALEAWQDALEARVRLAPDDPTI